MTTKGGGAAGGLTAPITETPPNQLDQVLALLLDLTTKQTALEERLTAQEQTRSPFRALGADERAVADEVASWPTPTPLGQGTGAPGTSAGGVHRQIPTTVRGHQVDAMTLQRHPPRFRPGDFVRLNPEAYRYGSTTLTYAEILEKRKSPGIGIVSKIFELRELADGGVMWKYQVKIKGLTPIQGDGFLDYELLPYERQRRSA